MCFLLTIAFHGSPAVCVPICLLLNHIKWHCKWATRLRFTGRLAYFISLLTRRSEGQRMRHLLKEKKRESREKTHAHCDKNRFTCTHLDNTYSCSRQCETITFERPCLGRAACIHLCACWPDSSSTQWAQWRGGSLRHRASLLHLFLTFPVGQQASRSS